MAPLDPGRRALVHLSALLGSGQLSELPRALERADAVAEPQAIEEVLLQSYLFVGFPAVFTAFGHWRERRSCVPDEPAGEETAGRAEWRRRGSGLCRRVYGSAYAQLRRNVTALHPALDRWMLEEGYGKVLARPGLDAATRELCIVSLLAAAGHGPQLHSHLRGALRVGATVAEVDEALDAGAARARQAAREAMYAVWREVRQRGLE